jgi:hypothetical protein
MSLVAFDGLREYEYVVKVYMDKRSDIVSEYGDHQSLESGWHIAISLLHDIADVCSVYCGKRCFPHILWNYPDLLICVQHVQFGPDSSLHHILVNDILVREQGHVFDCILVSLTSIHYRPNLGWVFLRDHH